MKKHITRNNTQVIKGHLLSNTTSGSKYTVIVYSYHSKHLIEDDTNKRIWVSNAALRKFFKN